MKIRLSTSALLALVLGANVFAADTARSQTANLRMHTFVPPVSGSYKIMDWWRNKVMKESGGSVNIQLFGSMQLGGKASDLYNQTKNGVVDLTYVLPGYTAGLFPRIGVFELPFIGDEADIVSPAIDDYVRKWGKEEWGSVQVVAAFTGGSSVLHTKSRPIVKLEDFRGMKIRTPSRISTKALTVLGATPVPIPGLKMTEAFMRNVVDGVIVPWSISAAIRVIDAAKFHTESPIHQPTLIIMMNKNSYEKLSPQAKKTIDANSGAAMAQSIGVYFRQDDRPARAKALKLGNKISTIDTEELAKWRKAVQPVYDAWVKDMTADGHPGQQLLDDAIALVDKYRKAAKK